jgi:hypothetical protein
VRVGAVKSIIDAIGKKSVVALIIGLWFAITVTPVMRNIIAVIADLSISNQSVSTCSHTRTRGIDCELLFLAGEAEREIGIAADCAINIVAGQVAVVGVDQPVRGGATEAVADVTGTAPF